MPFTTSMMTANFDRSIVRTALLITQYIKLSNNSAAPTEQELRDAEALSDILMGNPQGDLSILGTLPINLIKLAKELQVCNATSLDVFITKTLEISPESVVEIHNVLPVLNKEQSKVTSMLLSHGLTRVYVNDLFSTTFEAFTAAKDLRIYRQKTKAMYLSV